MVGVDRGWEDGHCCFGRGLRFVERFKGEMRAFSCGLKVEGFVIRSCDCGVVRDCSRNICLEDYFPPSSQPHQSIFKTRSTRNVFNFEFFCHSDASPTNTEWL